MTTRDRTLLMVVAALALLGGFWFFAIKPKRSEAQAVAGQVTVQRERLQTAQSTVATGLRAKADYADDYATVAELGAAVPTDDDLPSLLFQLESAAHGAHVEFRALSRNAAAASATATPTPAASGSAGSSGGSSAGASGSSAGGSASGSSGSASASAGGSSTSSTGSSAAASATPAPAPAAATQAASATLPPGATVGTAGLATLPFVLDFSGSYFDLERFLGAVQGFVRSGHGSVAVHGRLLTIDGISLVPGTKGLSNLQAKVAATAYLSPDTATPAGAASGPAITGSGPTTAGSAPTASSAAGPAPTSSAINGGGTQ